MAFAQSQDDMEDWERALTRPDGHPAIATAICLLVIFAIAVTQGLSERSFTVWTGLFVATGCAILLWIPAWLITIRHSGWGWRLGSLAIIWAVALLASLWAVRSANAALRYDRTMLDEIKWTPAKIILPEYPDRGLLSRAAIKLVNSFNEEKKKRQDLVTRLQPEGIGNVDAIARYPDILTDCDRFLRARPVLAASAKRTVDSTARFRAEVEASAIQPAYKKTFIADLDRRFAQQAPNSAAILRIVDEQLELTGHACTILARHHWQARGRSILYNGQRIELGDKTLVFTSRDDFKAYDVIARRSKELQKNPIL